MENNKYNLMHQLIQEQKSLWRINNHYIEEANNDEEKSFWEKMKKDKEEHIQELQGLVKNCL